MIQKFFCSQTDKICDAIADNLCRVSNELHAKSLIPRDTKEKVQTPIGLSNYEKASQLVNVIQKQIEASQNPKDIFIDICEVLRNQQYKPLTDIAESMLNQLGKYTYISCSALHQFVFQCVDQCQPFPVSSANLPSDVQRYIDILKEGYRKQPVVANDWPLKVGTKYFGRLVLVNENDSISQAEHHSYSWYMLRGHVDKIPNICGYEKVTAKTMLRCNADFSSRRLVVDGPPGIGKTTLCRKLLNIWSNKTSKSQDYELVLYCPLRDSTIAKATEIANLFMYKNHQVSKVVDWITDREGKGLLIIFDGWDELSKKLRKSSLVTDIVCGKQLLHCSVIITSRTYATYSLLNIVDNVLISQHIHVIGFDTNEIEKVIEDALSHDPNLAKCLIQDLVVRNDVLSLCYIPLVCSMVILVYRKLRGNLPTTLSELYENFILQTIKRHVKKASDDLEPQSLGSLNNLSSSLNKCLEELGEFAFLSLKKETNKMRFYSSQMQLLDNAKKENFLGMMTTIIDFDEEWYQFIHLSIQEFLAAWWIAKYEKTEEIFRNCFEDDHFRLCLRFVAGLTHLEHESYQQYFSSTQFDLECKERLLFERQFFSSWPSESSFIRFGNFTCPHMYRLQFCTLLHLLYESQNTKLCRILAQSIRNDSICLGFIFPNIEFQSKFDTLCFSYFIHNSSKLWNCLHFQNIIGSHWNIIYNGIDKSTSQCKTIMTQFLSGNELAEILLPLSCYLYVQEFYCDLVSLESLKEFFILIKFFELSQLSKLHINTKLTLNEATTFDCSIYEQELVELEDSIVNSNLQELCFSVQIDRDRQIEDTPDEITKILITSFLNGITRNKEIKSFKIEIKINHSCHPLPKGTIEHLLQDNKTLQKLFLHIPNHFISSLLNIKEVNTPLTALEINEDFSMFEKNEQSIIIPALLPYTRGLKCLNLMLYNVYPPYPLLLSNPNLQYLSLQLHTYESVLELFSSLMNNTTLLGLKVRIRIVESLNKTGNLKLYKANLVKTYIGKTLEDLLKQNNALQCLEIVDLFVDLNIQELFWELIPNFFLCFLNKGLVQNTCLKHLRVPIEVPTKGLKDFFDTLSQKVILTRLHLSFTIIEKDSFFSEDGLTHLTLMLRHHKNIKILRVSFKCFYLYLQSSLPPPNYLLARKSVNEFLDAVIFHRSLEYVSIAVMNDILMQNIFEQQINQVIKTYKEQERNLPPYIELEKLPFNFNE